MKKYYLFIALAMVAAMTVSCKNNNKKAKEAAEATEEVVEAAKTILADDVLATLDEIAKPFIDDAGKVDVQQIIAANLTEKEKLVKPDYLLDPSEVKTLVTKSQKINALAILLIEYPIRNAYEMPVDDAKEAIARLTADLNHPISVEDRDSMSVSEKVAESYRKCKENGELPYFWQFEFAVQTEADYLISKNYDVFFRSLDEEQYASFLKKITTVVNAVETLAKYDAEVKHALDIFNANRVNTFDISKVTMEDGKKFFSERKDVFAARRAALLK